MEERVSLEDYLYQKTVDQLKPLAKMCGPVGSTRKADLVQHLIKRMTTPTSVRRLWSELDPLSQKAIAAAYHNAGEFHEAGFLAQYGSLPERPSQSVWSWYTEPILLDLFLYGNTIPPEIMPLLADLVPPPEKFEVIGLKDQPTTVLDGQYPLPLTCAETEQAGQHDLLAYLRLVDQEVLKVGSSSSRTTLGGIKKIIENLLVGDFFPLPQKYRAAGTIRPFGLDVFAQEAKLVSTGRGSTTLKLTRQGQQFYQSQNPELLLAAFETWTEQGSFDELSRITAVKGQRAKGTRLTRPASRREKIIEALSWCPVGVWIDIEDFYRALKIWHFDFAVENNYYSNLYVGDREYGGLYGEAYWRMTKGLYANAIIFEYLGTIGAVDLLYTAPQTIYFESGLEYDYYDEEFSPYDGLKYFRINNLGAFLLGQVGEYVPLTPDVPPLFSVAADKTITLLAPAQLTPNDQHFLEQLATPHKKGGYKLDSQRLLTVLEEGADLSMLTEFLTSRSSTTLPESVTNWLTRLEANSQVFKSGGTALLIKVQSPDLAKMALADSALRKFCQVLDSKTLVVPMSREKQFRARLKELEYILVD